MSMRIIISAIIIILVVTLGASAHARPLKGFHTGPYLAFELGALQADFDHDESANADIGRPYEMSFGFLFGWNIKDSFSAELAGLYATSQNNGAREHLAGANMYGKYTFILNGLTDFKTFKVLPYVKGGVGTLIAALPGTAGSSKKYVTQFGIGPSVAGGCAFMLYKYFYFGFDVRGDFFAFDEIDQTVNGVPDTLVYKGGLKPIFGTKIFLGVHY